MAVEFTVPSRSDRPSTVTSAVVAVFAVLATTIASGVASAYVFAKILQAVRDNVPVDQMTAEDAAAFDTAMSIITIVLYLIAFAPALWAVGSAICAPFVAKGRNGARVTTWVFAGIGICCGALGLPVGGQTVIDSGGDPELERQLAEAMERIQIPDWLPTAQMVGTIAILLGYIAIVVLLALPKSNDYFRRPGDKQPTQFLDI